MLKSNVPALLLYASLGFSVVKEIAGTELLLTAPAVVVVFVLENGAEKADVSIARTPKVTALFEKELVISSNTLITVKGVICPMFEKSSYRSLLPVIF